MPFGLFRDCNLLDRKVTPQLRARHMKGRASARMASRGTDSTQGLAIVPAPRFYNRLAVMQALPVGPHTALTSRVRLGAGRLMLSVKRGARRSCARTKGAVVASSANLSLHWSSRTLCAHPASPSRLRPRVSRLASSR